MPPETQPTETNSSLPQNQIPAVEVPAIKDEIDFGGRLLKFNELLTAAWSWCKPKYWTLLATFAIPIGALVLNVLVPVGLTAAGIGKTPVNIVQIAISLMFTLVMYWQTMVMLYLIDGVKTGVTFKEAGKKAAKKVFAYWWVVVLDAAITIGAFVPLIIPGLILSVQFSFAVPVLALEDIGGLSALLKSRNYVRGKGWAIFGRIASISLLAVVVLIPAFILTELVAGGNSQLKETLNDSFSLLLVPAVPIITTFNYLLYKNAKALYREETVKAKGRFGWYLLAGWGVIVPILLIGAMIFLMLSPTRHLSNVRDKYYQEKLREVQTGVKFYYTDKDKLPQKLEDLYPTYINDTVYLPIKDWGFKATPVGVAVWEVCLTPTDGEEICR